MHKLVFVKQTLESLHHLHTSKFCNKALYEAVFGAMETFERVKLTKMCILKFTPNKGHPSAHPLINIVISA